MSRTSIREVSWGGRAKGPSSRPQDRQVRTYCPSGAPTFFQRCIPSRQRNRGPDPAGVVTTADRQPGGNGAKLLFRSSEQTAQAR
jgi:hypothetical protein